MSIQMMSTLFLTETTKSDEVQVAFSAGAFSLSTCKSTEQEDANSVPTNHCDKPKHTDIECEYTSHDPCCW